MFLLQNTGTNIYNHPHYSKFLVYNFFAIRVGDIKFGLHVDLMLQTT